MFGNLGPLSPFFSFFCGSEILVCYFTSLEFGFFISKVRASSLKFHDSITENICEIKRRMKIVWGVSFALVGKLC